MKKAETIRKLFEGFAVYDLTVHHFKEYTLARFKLGYDAPNYNATAYYDLYLYDKQPKGVSKNEWL